MPIELPHDYRQAAETTMDPIPEGWYRLMVAETNQKSTKSGTGSYLEIKYQVLDQAHEGRLLWDRLNLWNPSDAAVRIAKSTLKSLCMAARVNATNAEELHGKIVSALVTVRAGNGGHSPSNEIRRYEPVNTLSRYVDGPAAGSDTGLDWS